MAFKFRYDAPGQQTGLRIYVVVRDGAALAWNITGTPAFATYTTTRTNFVVALAEIGTTGSYVADVVGGVGFRDFDYFLAPAGAGSESHTGDVLVQIESGYYDGTELVAGAVRADGSTIPTAEQIADEVEAQIIDETDSEKVLEAIVNKINAMTDLDALTTASIAVAVRDLIFTVPGRQLAVAVDGSVTVGTNGDKTGYTLADGSITSAKFSVAAATPGRPSGFLERLQWLCLRFFNRVRKTTAGTTKIEVFDEDDATVLTEQAVTSVGGVTTVGKAEGPV